MSHQGYPYWFPECFICGMGNLSGVVCMTPQIDEAHGGLVPIKGAMTGISEQIERDGHHWKRCLLCPTEMLADPVAWGSLAYCIGCWNRFVERGVYPPAWANQVRRMSADEWG